jgi:hypothetical protein
MTTTLTDGKSIRKYSSRLHTLQPAMNSVNPGGVPPEATRAAAKAGRLVTQRVWRQTSRSSQTWPNFGLVRYLDAEAERREVFRRFRRTAASKR